MYRACGCASNVAGQLQRIAIWVLVAKVMLPLTGTGVVT
jgi:hypothetical protein